MMKTIRKLHKWTSLILGGFLVLFALSGIVMNHRQFFSGVNVPRGILPPDYQYRNWNLAAIKGNVPLNDTTFLVYGNIGVYSVDTAFGKFSDFNSGFGNGIDRRKVFSLLNTPQGNLYAGTLFGLFRFDVEQAKWLKVDLPEPAPRVVSVQWDGKRVLALTRSHLYSLAPFEAENPAVTEVVVPPAADDDGKAGLFRTLWEIHSGELWGLAGKLLVDFIGLVLIFLVLSGYYYVFFPAMARRSSHVTRKRLGRFNKFLVRWHNHLGVWTLVFLLITSLTGMFLRPPLLIPVAGKRIAAVPGSHLAGNNRWFDKFRDFVVQPDGHILLSTSDGFYSFNPQTDTVSAPFEVQPEVSVMGITALKSLPDSGFLVASFSGLYRWYPAQSLVVDHITGLPAGRARRGNPFGAVAVSGVIMKNGIPQAFVDYDAGWIPLKLDFPVPLMPEDVSRLPFSLWNFALEVHTGRIFSFLIGGFYILYVPLMGLSSIFILVTGFWLWLKIRLRKRQKNSK